MENSNKQYTNNMQANNNSKTIYDFNIGQNFYPSDNENDNKKPYASANNNNYNNYNMNNMNQPYREQEKRKVADALFDDSNIEVQRSQSKIYEAPITDNSFPNKLNTN